LAWLAAAVLWGGCRSTPEAKKQEASEVMQAAAAINAQIDHARANCDPLPEGDVEFAKQAIDAYLELKRPLPSASRELLDGFAASLRPSALVSKQAFVTVTPSGTYHLPLMLLRRGDDSELAAQLSIADDLLAKGRANELFEQKVRAHCVSRAFAPPDQFAGPILAQGYVEQCEAMVKKAVKPKSVSAAAIPLEVKSAAEIAASGR
jgi:hypothetical protein